MPSMISPVADQSQRYREQRHGGMKIGSAINRVEAPVIGAATDDFKLLFFTQFLTKHSHRGITFGECRRQRLLHRQIRLGNDRAVRLVICVGLLVVNGEVVGGCVTDNLLYRDQVVVIVGFLGQKKLRVWN